MVFWKVLDFGGGLNKFFGLKTDILIKNVTKCQFLMKMTKKDDFFEKLSKKERARTTAAATTEEFPQSIQVPSSTHPGTTYPVRAIPHSDKKNISEVGGGSLAHPTGKSFRFVRACVRAVLVKSFRSEKVALTPCIFYLLWFWVLGEFSVISSWYLQRSSELPVTSNEL